MPYSNNLKVLIVLVGDIAVFYASLTITLIIRYGYAATIWGEHYRIFSLLLILWLAVFYISDLYNLRRNARDIQRLVLSSVIIAFVLSIIFFYIFPTITPKTNLVIDMVIFTLLFAAWRLAMRKLLSSAGYKNVVVIGLNKKTVKIIRTITEHYRNEFRVAAVFTTTRDNTDHTQALGALANDDDSLRITIIAGVKNLAKFIRRHRVGLLIVSQDALFNKDILNGMTHSLSSSLEIMGLPSFYEYTQGKIPLETINQVWFLENITKSSDDVYKMLKRLIDFAGGMVGLAFLAVIFIPVALFIKLDTAGTVIYRQQKIGKDKKPFTVYKLRTMVAYAEAQGAAWTVEHDPRITRIGGFLRKTRIDELPQCWNILRGEMSLVGPRAERPEFHATLAKQIPFFEERYLVKPGLTGWAQLQRNYGSSVADTKEKIEYDLYYLKNKSIALDLSIILKTISLVVLGKGK